MTWLHPEHAALVAIGIAAVAAIAGLSWLAARRRARRLLGAASVPSRNALLRDLALVAAIAAIGGAALGPQLGMRALRVPGSGVDVVLLLDVSRSMEASDVPPSRLVRARELAQAVVERLAPDDRAALAVFADRGVVLAPLSPDADAIGELVGAIDGDLVLPRGSDLGAGVRAALGAFDAASERPRVVLAIGDGEDADARDPAIALARRAQARVVAVAIGTESGAPVPDGDAVLVGADAKAVVTRRDAARLEALAAATDGTLVRADRFGDLDLDALVAAVRRDAAQSQGGVVERRVPATRVAPFVALAIALLALEAIGGVAGLRSAVPRSRRLAAASIAAALAIAPLASATAPDRAIAGLEAHLRTHPGDARALIALGVARAEAERLDEAAHALRAAAVGSRRREDAALAYYDLGVVELRRERFEAARDAFLDALALAPDDDEARFNLEWAQRALASQPPEQRSKSASDDAEDEDERPDPDAPGADDSTGRSAADSGLPPPVAPPPTAARPESRPSFAPELSPDRVEQWLDGVADDPARGLRDAARAGQRGRAQTRAARW